MHILVVTFTYIEVHIYIQLALIIFIICEMMPKLSVKQRQFS